MLWFTVDHFNFKYSKNTNIVFQHDNAFSFKKMSRPQSHQLLHLNSSKHLIPNQLSGGTNLTPYRDMHTLSHMSLADFVACALITICQLKERPDVSHNRLSMYLTPTHCAISVIRDIFLSRRKKKIPFMGRYIYTQKHSAPLKHPLRKYEFVTISLVVFRQLGTN